MSVSWQKKMKYLWANILLFLLYGDAFSSHFPFQDGACQPVVDCVWNVMTHAQKPDFVFRRNGRIHLNRRGASVQSTTGSWSMRISARYNMFRGSVKCTGYPLHSPVSPSLPLPCVTVCHHISTVFYSTHKFLLNAGNIFGIKQCYTRKTLQWLYY